jgi:hypothetical protein
MRRATSYIFADATERDTFVGFGTGVQNGDTCVLLSDQSAYYYDDSNVGGWIPLGGAAGTVKTTDATLEQLFVSAMPSDFTTQQFEVWFQSVRDTGTNWRFERLAFTAHRIGGTATLSAPVAIVPATSAGTGATLVYGFTWAPNFIFADITANAAENWTHTIRVVVTQAGP